MVKAWFNKGKVGAEEEYFVSKSHLSTLTAASEVEETAKNNGSQRHHLLYAVVFVVLAFVIYKKCLSKKSGGQGNTIPEQTYKAAMSNMSP